MFFETKHRNEASLSNLRARTVLIAGTLVTLAAIRLWPTDYSPTPNEEIFWKRAKIAEELNQETYSAIMLADTDVRSAVQALGEICPRAKQFLESEVGPEGWEYPGDYPESLYPFQAALTASLYSCYLHDWLEEGSYGTFAREAARFFQERLCLLDRADSSPESCPPF